MYNEELFPIYDEIQLPSREGIPEHYDVRKLLSEAFKNKIVWSDLSDVITQVMYENIETQRIALGMSRSPENVHRIFKIQLSKLLGFDYKSDFMQDADYDRMISNICQYQVESKGPDHFLNFIGFIKNTRLELVKLWTTDYKEFHIGLPIGARTVYQTPQGDFYPTTHVGILYEEFATEEPLDLRDLEEVFYEVAPINLVLKWIAALITIHLPMLYLCLNFVEQEEITLFPEQLNRHYWYWSTVPFDQQEILFIANRPEVIRWRYLTDSIYGFNTVDGGVAIYRASAASTFGYTIVQSNYLEVSGNYIITDYLLTSAERYAIHLASETFTDYDLLADNMIETSIPDVPGDHIVDDNDGAYLLDTDDAFLYDA